jgi:diguanylate cyclase (GGDEF)-like protein
VLAAAAAQGTVQRTRLADEVDSGGDNQPTRYAWRADHPIFVSRGASPEAPPLHDDFGALAALPIHQQEQIVAVLTVCCALEDGFDSETRDLLVALVSRIESGLQDLWQRGRIANLQRLYHALISEGDVVLQARSSTEMLQQTCEKLVNGTQFHAVLVGRPDAQGWVEVLAHAGSGAELLENVKVSRRDAHAASILRAWNSQTLIYNNDHLADPHVQGAVRAFCVKHGWNATLAAPVLRAGQVWAILLFVSAQPQVFDHQTIDLCKVVTALLGHGLDEMDLKQRLSELQQEESHRARHDALTGLPNRYAMEQQLSRAMSQARRRGSVLAVGMIDLDDFKPVNDTWGHSAGDRLLQELSLRLQSHLRASDLLARLGGDEFIIMIEDLDEQCAIQQLDELLTRVHQAVEQPFDLGPGQRAVVGMSMGLALYPRDAEDADVLMHQADSAMYQAKQHKHDRACWWQFSTVSQEKPAREPVFAAYSAEAAALLDKNQGYLLAVGAQFSQSFVPELGKDPQAQQLLAPLGAERMQGLLHAQLKHFHFLLDPGTTQEMVLSRARHLGVVHAMVGVNSALLVQMYALYRQLLGDHLNRALLPARERYHLLRTAESRIQDNIQTELNAGQRTTDAYLEILAAPLPAESMLWVDALQLEIDALASLPGVRACQVLRPNIHGLFQVEASAGVAAEVLSQILGRPGLQPALDAREPTGTGLIPTAWRSGELASTAFYLHDERTRAWHDELLTLAVHSMLAIPILTANGSPVMILAIEGGYPNQFASKWMQQFAKSLQQRWAMIWQHCNAPQANSALSQTLAQQYRVQLFGGGLMMYMQPIVDLHSGKVVKVEALARLRMPGGQIIAPAVFLPLLGTVELDRLFRLGLELALCELVAWEAQGLKIEVSVNLPPSVLLDPECLSWVAEALERHQLAPQRLNLELLETQRMDILVQDEAITQLTQLGVKLSMDDLGSGYSSLQRLSTLPFSTIKSDQGLLLRLYENPVQTLSLIGSIIQMGQDFERDVVVEGLEDSGMIEAAALLGARYGQGYALARPMPAGEIVAWSRRFRLPIELHTMSTVLGALAYHWQFMHKQGTRHTLPLAACPMSGLLDSLGNEAGEAEHWHAQIHAGDDADQASLRLNTWLTHKTCESHASGR